MLRLTSAFVLTFSLIWMITSQAYAEPDNCMSYTDLTALLADRFNEKPLAAALSSQGDVISIYTAPDGRWTVTITQSGGQSCVVAAGSAFTFMHRDGLTPDATT